MGALANLRANRKTFKVGSPLDQWAVRQIKRLNNDNGAAGDIPVEAAAASVDEVQSLAASTQTSGNMTLTFSIQQDDKSFEDFTTANIAYDTVSGAAEDAVHTIAQDDTDHTGGTFALTVSLFSGETFTTAAIAYNANAATIETAIDVAATAASITGWSNGDISVSGGILQAAGAAVVLTFDGSSVAGEPSHTLTTFDGSLLTGGAEPATRVSDTTVGLEADINIAARSAGITGWVDGSIQVAGVAVNSGALTFTFSGAATGLNNALTVLADVDGAGGAWGAITQTTAGQTERAAWSILLSYGIIESTIPEQDAAASLTSVTKGTGTETHQLPAVIVKQLMMEAAAEDVNNGAYFSLEKAVFPQDRSPLIETRLTSDAEVHEA